MSSSRFRVCKYSTHLTDICCEFAVHDTEDEDEDVEIGNDDDEEEDYEEELEEITMEYADDDGGGYFVCFNHMVVLSVWCGFSSNVNTFSLVYQTRTRNTSTTTTTRK